MASQQPPEPPESITIQQFAGIHNRVSPERLQPGELEAAVNVDIDDAGELRRRRGYARRVPGNFHSLSPAGDLVVKDGYLNRLYPGFELVQVGYVGGDRLSYAPVGAVVYFSSVSSSGKVVDNAITPWGAHGGEGLWLSPVVQPTETLGAIAGKLLGAPPLASEIELYKGRIYLAAGRTMWVTELYQYDYVDRTRGFYQFEHDITMIAAVGDGLYIGTEGGLHFLHGTHSTGLQRTDISDGGVIRGSRVAVPAAVAHPAARQSPQPDATVPMFLTAQGICAGFDGGEVHNLTRDTVVLPSALGAAALYREQDGVRQYVAVTDGGGTPTSSARIGDFVDAEIRRFQGG